MYLFRTAVTREVRLFFSPVLGGSRLRVLFIGKLLFALDMTGVLLLPRASLSLSTSGQHDCMCQEDSREGGWRRVQIGWNAFSFMCTLDTE